jgi:hypothetical protein
MTAMQRLCHEHLSPALPAALCLCSLVLYFLGLYFPGAAARADPPSHDYPTHARVAFVQECIAAHGSKFSNLHQCSCAIDRIANTLSYDDFVEASTFSKYSGLAGERGGLFRDSDHAREMAKLYRDTEANALRSCGLGS